MKARLKNAAKVVWYWIIFLFLWGITAFLYIPLVYTLAGLLSVVGSLFNGEVKYTFRNILEEVQVESPRKVYRWSNFKEINEVFVNRVYGKGENT